MSRPAPSRAPRRWWVTYEALGQKCAAGPYGLLEVQEHRDDIAGYDGIARVEMTREEPGPEYRRITREGKSDV